MMTKAVTIKTAIMSAFLTVFAVMLFLFIRAGLMSVYFPFSLEQNEGVMLYITRQILHGTIPYQPIENTSVFINNYPPLYALCCALLDPLFRLPFAAGRMIAFISILCITALSGLITFKYTRSLLLSIIAACFFLATPVIFWKAWFYRVDAFAVCLSMAGFYVVLLTDKTRRAWLCGVVLLAAGIYAKHSTIAAPIAVCAAMVLHRHPKRWQLISAMAAMTIIPGLILQVITRGQFLIHILTYTMAGVSMPDFGLHVKPFVPYCIWWVLSIAYGIRYTRHLSDVEFTHSAVLLYGASTAASLLLLFKEGASNLYFIELMAISAALGAIALYNITQSPSTAQISVAGLMMCFALIPWVFGPLPHFKVCADYSSYLAALKQREREIFRRVRAAQGPVLCENISYPVLCGKDPQWIPFMIKQLAERGLIPDHEICNKIRAQQFELIVLETKLKETDGRVIVSPVQMTQLTSGIMQAIASNYKIEQNLSYVPPQVNRYVRQKTVFYRR